MTVDVCAAQIGQLGGRFVPALEFSLKELVVLSKCRIVDDAGSELFEFDLQLLNLARLHHLCAIFISLCFEALLPLSFLELLSHAHAIC